MQSLRSDREQRVVSELGAMGNNQGTGSSDERKQRAAREEGTGSVKGGKKRENRGEIERGGNLGMKHWKKYTK